MDPLVRLDAEFKRCARWIAPSLKYANGCYDLQDLYNACMSGAMQLWPGERSALISEVCRYPQRSVINVAFAGGDLNELRAMAPQIIEWGKQMGCDLASIHGRKGWVRALGIGRIVSTIAIEEI